MHDELTQLYAAAAEHRLSHCAQKIKHCLGQLTDEQVWWRPFEQHNSIANIVLHMCGNLRQWVISVLTGAADNRQRAREFSERGPISKRDLAALLDETVAEATAALRSVSAEQLLATCRVQGFEETGLSAIFESAAHFTGHTHQVIYVTRLQLGDRYMFHWAPSTADEGA